MASVSCNGTKGHHKFTLEVIQASQSVTDNKTTVSFSFNISPVQTTWDWYDWGSKISYTVTINGTSYTGAIPSYDGKSTVTLKSGTQTVSHNADGTKSISFSFSVKDGSGQSYTCGDASGSGTLTLSVIPRASTIDSAEDVTLGNACSVKWTPKASTFRYKLKFSIGSWSHTTGVIHPNKTSVYTYSGYSIPLDVANQIPNARTGTMTVTLYTYSDSGATSQVGSADSETFTITVPDNSSTKPTVSMSLSPVGTLPSAFAGLYIQGLTKVKATLSAQGKYGTSINSYRMWADGFYRDSDDDYTSGYLSTAGTRSVYGYATDKRGHTGEITKNITVIPYSNPDLVNTSAIRCDRNGNQSESGTYLKITAKRSYSPVMSGGAQKNFCSIQYRYSNGDSYSQWVTILGRNNLSSDSVSTGPLLEGVLSAQASYTVHIRAIDDIGRYAETYITVPTEKIYMHRSGAYNSIGLGKYVERVNAVDSAWDIFMNEHRVVGLPSPYYESEATPKKYVDNLFEGSYFAYRDNCGDANEAKLSGVYRLTGKSTNAPNNNGILLVFNASYNDTSSAPVWQVAMDYNGANRKCRMMWYGNTPTGWTDL